MLLGASFDRKISQAPHLQSMVSTAGSLVALTRRLLIHLPSQYVQEVARSLVQGKLCYGSLLIPHRRSEEDPTCHLMQAVQTKINDVARLLLGASRADKVPVQELLQRTKLPSLNRNSVRMMIVEMWKALCSKDGTDGSRNPLGSILSPP